MRADWPLVGRLEEVAFLGATRDSARAGVVISGAPGVGKTRFAAEATAAADAAGWSTVSVRATPGMNALPMAAFAHVRPEAAADRFAAVTAALVNAAAGRPLWMSVDDAHLLDETSAGLVHHMAVTARAFAVVTTRAGAPQPAAITALWKDGDAARLELQALSRGEADAFARLLLDGELEPATARRLWSITEGNPLFLRELVQAGLESGQLEEHASGWRWSGVLAGSGRLAEVIEERLGRLDDDARSTLGIVALAGEVSIDALVRVASVDSVDRLERAGLLSLEFDERRQVARVTHPLYGEVLRAATPTLRARAVYRQLADATEAVGSAAPRDRIRVAMWRMEHGAEIDADSLLEASTAARWSVRSVLVEQIRDALVADGGEVPPATSEEPPPWRPGAGDFDLGLRLARHAWEVDHNPATGTALADMLVYGDRLTEAADVLAQVEAVAVDETDRTRIAIARSTLLFWGCARPDEALDVLARAEAAAGDVARDETVRREISRDRAGILVNIGRPADALAVARAALEPEGGSSDLRAAPTAAAALSLLGRSGEAIEIVDRYLPLAMGDAGRSALAMGELVFARVSALVHAGRLAEARSLATVGYDVSLGSSVLEGTAAFGIMLGQIELLSGRARTAVRRFREAESLLAERDAFAYRRWALAGVAHAGALVGDRDGALAAWAAAEQLATTTRFFDAGAAVAHCALLVLEHDTRAAADEARRAATIAERGGVNVDAALAWHAAAAARPDDHDAVAEIARRLDHLRAVTDSELLAALAHHVSALAARDADDLDAAAGDFESLGALLFAAEAAAQAAVEHDRNGRARRAQAATRRAQDLAARCEGAHLPAFDRIGAPSGLTPRELEIARLAADGLASKAIAERLVVSTRTVDSHLYRVYAKLGVTTRTGLADTMARSWNPGAN